jgi:hypothetical protein
MQTFRRVLRSRLAQRPLKSARFDSRGLRTFRLAVTQNVANISKSPGRTAFPFLRRAVSCLNHRNFTSPFGESVSTPKAPWLSGLPSSLYCRCWRSIGSEGIWPTPLIGKRIYSTNHSSREGVFESLSCQALLHGRANNVRLKEFFPFLHRFPHFGKVGVQVVGFLHLRAR